MARMILLLALLASSMFLVNCTEAPPLPPGGETNPPTPGDTRLPGETGPPPNTLKQVSRATLPRQALAVFVHGDTSFSCTPEGTLYNVKVADIRSFSLTAMDLKTGKHLWTHKGTKCAFRIDGEELHVSRYLSRDAAELQFERLELKTGKVLGSIKMKSEGCSQIRISGAGEKLFAISSSQTHSCYDFSIKNGKLLVRTESVARLFDVDSGKELWNYRAGRVVSAFVQGDMAYVVEGVKELEPGAVSLPASTLVSPSLTYQLRAVTLSGDTSWVAGPLPGLVVSAKLSVLNGSLLVQAINPTSSVLGKGTPLEVYGRQGWSGALWAFSLDAKTGRSKWESGYVIPLSKTSVTAGYGKDKKTTYDPMPVPSAPIALEQGLLIQAPGLLVMLNGKGTKSWSMVTNDRLMSHVEALSNQHIHMRSSEGHSTLLELIPKRAPKVTRGGDVGSLLYAADGIAPDAKDKSKGPSERLSVRGFCLKFDGQPVPMKDIRNNTRFFLPPANHYYTPASFFSAFCARYLIDVVALNMSDETVIWKSRALVPEAPVFFFVRGGILYVLSDNGDWYHFSIK